MPPDPTGPVRPGASLRETGSALVLVPATMLVVLLLGAIAVDRAVLVAEQADLVHTAQAAASAGAQAGVDLEVLRAEGTLAIDRPAIGRAVESTVAVADPAIDATWSIRGGVVEVRLRRPAPAVFSPAVGDPPVPVVEATASATLEVRPP